SRGRARSARALGRGDGRRHREGGRRHDRHRPLRQRWPEAAVAPVRASGGDGLMIGDKDVEHVARLARLALTESERARMREQLSAILQYIDKLKAVDVEGVEPTSHAVPLLTVMRHDEAAPSWPHHQATDTTPA